MAKLGFGELELSIHKIVRELERASVRDVVKCLGNGVSYTTIMTVMSRMEEKGELMREKMGKQFIYWLAPQKNSKSVLKRIRDKIFGGKQTAMVTYLLEEDPEITDSDLEELELLIRKRRAERKHG